MCLSSQGMFRLQAPGASAWRLAASSVVLSRVMNLFLFLAGCYLGPWPCCVGQAAPGAVLALPREQLSTGVCTALTVASQDHEAVLHILTRKSAWEATNTAVAEIVFSVLPWQVGGQCCRQMYSQDVSRTSCCL